MIVSADTFERVAPIYNSQPWRVANEDGRIVIMSPEKAFYFNRIDMGIYLCILKICLAERNVSVVRTLFPDLSDVENAEVAEYMISGI